MISHSFSFCEYPSILSNCHFSFALDYHNNLYFELTTPMLILLLYILQQRDYIYCITEHCCSSPVWRESLFWGDTSQIRSSKVSLFLIFELRWWSSEQQYLYSILLKFFLGRGSKSACDGSMRKALTLLLHTYFLIATVIIQSTTSTVRTT